jgi:hypothetical protein
MWPPRSSCGHGRCRRRLINWQLSAIRHSFDQLVIGQVVPRNPAASVRGPSHAARQRKTTVLDATEASPSGALLWGKSSDLPHRHYHQPPASNLNKFRVPLVCQLASHILCRGQIQMSAAPPSTTLLLGAYIHTYLKMVNKIMSNYYCV